MHARGVRPVDPRSDTSMVGRAYIHIAGPEGSGKTAFIEALLAADFELAGCMRGVCDPSIRDRTLPWLAAPTFISQAPRDRGKRHSLKRYWPRISSSRDACAGCATRRSEIGHFHGWPRLHSYRRPRGIGENGIH